ncbi:MAG: hypothetical protein DRQ42_00375 [Gammaproteobacteria bacterium]|nr:MAG: hypothetical protein DRQ42_00375 [Gammaproteobacteria bacterium]
MTSNFLQTKWEDYSQAVLERTTEYKSIRRHYLSYMTGALHTFITLDKIYADMDLSNEAKSHLIGEVYKEIQKFVEEVNEITCKSCPDREECVKEDCLK